MAAAIWLLKRNLGRSWREQMAHHLSMICASTLAGLSLGLRATVVSDLMTLSGESGQGETVVAAVSVLLASIIVGVLQAVLSTARFLDVKSKELRCLRVFGGRPSSVVAALFSEMSVPGMVQGIVACCCTYIVLKLLGIVGGYRNEGVVAALIFSLLLPWGTSGLVGIYGAVRMVFYGR